MLLVLMFHKVTEPNDQFEHLEQFFLYLKTHYSIVLPGDLIPKLRLSVCLTFDDAYADFYWKVFPLLKKHQIPAVLAVPTGFILEDTLLLPTARMAITQSEAMTGENYKKAPFCTWQELKEMHDSELVKLASHYHTHASSKTNDFDINKELVYSRQLLTSKSGKAVDTLVYPYGHYSKEIHTISCQHYTYIMRIGYAINLNWGGNRQLIYRVDADPFWQTNLPFRFLDHCKWRLKWLSNQLRRR